jgi:hypothetical protein
MSVWTMMSMHETSNVTVIVTLVISFPMYLYIKRQTYAHRLSSSLLLSITYWYLLFRWTLRPLTMYRSSHVYCVCRLSHRSYIRFEYLYVICRYHEVCTWANHCEMFASHVDTSCWHQSSSYRLKSINYCSNSYIELTCPSIHRSCSFYQHYLSVMIIVTTWKSCT